MNTLFLFLFNFVSKNYKTFAVFLIALVIGVFLLSQKRSLEKRAERAEERVTELSIKLATAEETIEISSGLYAKVLKENTDLNTTVIALLETADFKNEQIEALSKQLEESGGKLLAANVLVLKWKKAYEGAVDASQTEEPPDPDQPDAPIRKRVDFKKDFGYIEVTGHTITDPAEGFVSVKQLRPLKLALAISQNKDGSWSTYVVSSEDGIEVDIDSSGIDLKVAREKVTWRDRTQVVFEADVFGEYSVGAGILYDFKKSSIGLGCSKDQNDWSCGLRVGYRIFK